jgi:hypothetical protein
MKHFETKLVPESSEMFICKKCDYSSVRYSQYKRHLSTDKHKIRQNETNETNLKQNSSKTFQCFCGINFNSRTSLWRHSKKCNNKSISNIVTTELVLELIRDNKEMKQLLMEQNHTIQQQSSTINNLATTKQISGENNVNSYNTIINDNKTFNLNVFLNETCKDAMNISDFVSSIKVNLSDLENTGRVGYIEGVSNIILKNLNNLEHHFRPLHCSDSKREVIYIKDNNEWKKETEAKPILTKAIKVIANENIKQIKYWRDKYPDCTDSDSKKNNLYLKIVSNSMNGSTEEESCKNIDKIISNVAKEVIINKTV